MKKNIKKITVLAAMAMFSLSVMAGPWSTFFNNNSDDPGANGGSMGGDDDNDNDGGNGEPASGPVGTATLLMLGMGGAYLGYKVKKNNKDKE